MRGNILAVSVFLGIISNILCDNKPILRGIDPSKAQLYANKNGKFTCFSGSKTIRYDQINDDFCDCSDGSDEPGSAACTNGKFFCNNTGFKSITIPSSRVNDGVCDCCDASDEYMSSANCINNCIELGSADRLREKQRLELLKSGNQIRLDMSERGKKLKEEQRIRLNELEKARDQADKVREEKRTIKTEAEILENDALDIYKKADEENKRQLDEKQAEQNRIEAEETFIKFDSNKDGKIEVTELQTRITFDKNRNGVVEVEEARYFLDENDELELESFITLAWPRIKPFLMLDAGLFKPPRKDHEERNEENDYDDNGEEAELLNEDEGYDNEEQSENDEENAEEKPSDTKVEYDDETQRLIEAANEARNQYTVADREFREIDDELNKLRNSLEKDFGPEEEFAPLSGECFDFEDREYIYKLCPFDKATQQPKNGGSDTRLGTWDNWKSNDYRQMYYANGASCWNGPNRSVLVEIECGLDTRILSVSEPNRCEYYYKFQTPAACRATSASEVHDEL